MSGVRVLLVAAPLQLTVWVLVAATAVIVAVIAIGVALHVGSVRADRRRKRVRDELEPVFATFFETEDQERLAEELRPAFMRMDAAHRPMAALLVTDLMGTVSSSHTEQVRSALEQAGIVELGERGTRRLSPWRRALACEMLGKIGARRSVPALLQRIEDRRPEVRISAVRSLGDIGATEAVPALSGAFLERRYAPTTVVGDALRRIGGEAMTTFEQGLASPDPIIRVSSCYGLSWMVEARDACVFRLALVLDLDSDARVRAAAASALGILGGDDAPAVLRRATTDAHLNVRRSAVKALGSFDDATIATTLDELTEDDDRETALLAAEALVALSRLSRAAPEAHARLDSSSAWAVEYAQLVAEVSA